MADILKISTPLVEKQPILGARPVADPTVPFNLSDVSRVLQTTDPAEILQQNTGFVPQEQAPKILSDLLKDPSVTVGLIKNIYMLQEVIKLLPANNTPLTQEIQQLFDSLLLKPEQVVSELHRQELSTTLFKGELFDQLRLLLGQSYEKPEVATSIGILLKGLNATISRRDALDSVSNNLSFLADSLESSVQLSERLQTLIGQLRAPDAPANFISLKREVMDILVDIEKSVLFNPQMEKTLPLIIYNLSRFNDNDEFLPEALRLLLSNMDGDASKAALVKNLQAYIDTYMPPEGARRARAAEEESQVMDVLAKIIGRQASSEELHLLSGDKVEKIIHSLLSSPSNFTPLLHFIVPVQYQDLKAFAEIWIDPNAEEAADPKRGGGEAEATHMLLVFDIEGIGRFESELYVQNKKIALNLLCPPAYTEAFKKIGPAIRQAVAATGYSFEAINIERLERTHSLMDVFTDLPHKRTGIDVRV